jgi:cytochrome c biogenesis protein CcmG, thiol:disulfide interchange protein DsbE
VTKWIFKGLAEMQVKQQWYVVGTFFVLLLALIAAGWSVRDRFLPVEVGSTAPNITATTLDGEPVELRDLRGEVILLNVWATWCPPCREEMPSMQRLHDRLGPEGLHIVAVSIDSEPGGADRAGRRGGDIQAFAESYGLTFTLWHDPEGDIQRQYRTTGVPESFLIDRTGTVVKKVIGAIEWDSEANVQLIHRLLRE